MTGNELATRLGLPSPHQDWGIEHADACRIADFVAILRQRSLDDRAEWMLFELIINSQNDALLEGNDPLVTRRDLAEVRERLSLHPVLEKYYLSLANESEFPIAAYLRKVTGASGA